MIAPENKAYIMVPIPIGLHRSGLGSCNFHMPTFDLTARKKANSSKAGRRNWLYFLFRQKTDKASTGRRVDPHGFDIFGHKLNNRIKLLIRRNDS